MLICMDIGNSQIHIGFYENNGLIQQLRLETKAGWDINSLGQKLSSLIGVDYKNTGIVVASVVPSLNPIIEDMCLKYFNCSPMFVNVHLNTGLKYKYNHPNEIGADLICGAVAAMELYPNYNLLVVDMGTATTIVAVNKNKEFITGVILPGIATQVSSLSNSAELLSKVKFDKPKNIIADNTSEAILSGVYYGHLGAIKYIVKKLGESVFGLSKYIVVTTGGLTRFYKDESIFSNLVEDLVLQGMKSIYNSNVKK